MPNPLAAHPPWRQLLIVSVALPVVITLAVLAFAWPAARVQPRDLPVGVVGSGAGSQQAIEHLATARPGAFDFHLYPDEAAARTAIRNRDIYGAFVVDQQHVQVVQASAASPTVAQLLDDIGAKLSDVGAKLAAGTSSTQSSTDIVPLSHADPKGTVFSSALLPLTMCSLLVAAAIGVVARFRPAKRQIGVLIMLSAITGACVYLIGQSFLGALPHQGLADWAALSLTVLAMAAAAAGLVALFGAAGLGIAGALMVFVGNPFSGVTSAPELLPDAVKHIGQALPPGAGACCAAPRTSTGTARPASSPCSPPGPCWAAPRSCSGTTPPSGSPRTTRPANRSPGRPAQPPSTSLEPAGDGPSRMVCTGIKLPRVDITDGGAIPMGA